MSRRSTGSIASWRVFQPSPLAIYLAEAEKFWTLSEPYRLLHLAAADAPVAAEHRGR